MDVTGNGDVVLARAGDLPMEANLSTSAASEKPSTRKTKRLTPEEALEILAQAVAYCNEVGIDVRGPQPFRDGDVEYLVIVLANVRLIDGRLVLRLAVSTALNGPGEQSGSGCTPRGLHRVRAKIGEGLPAGAVLRGRRWTGEVWTPALHEAFPGRDWILSRILWLSGCAESPARRSRCFVPAAVTAKRGKSWCGGRRNRPRTWRMPARTSTICAARSMPKGFSPSRCFCASNPWM